MKRLLFIIPFFAFILVLGSCARMSTPSGGLVDETPPVMESSKPVANSLGFDNNEVRIFFDEIVVLKDLTTNFIVSPPMERTPAVKAYGRELNVEFEEEFQENTTYTLYFGDAVVDNNEGNVLSNYTFSFSTGYELDTMRLQGYVIDAETLSPASGIMVGIYSDFADSAFTSSVPMRIALTNELGWFSVNNVRPGKYKIRALNDMDNNFRFNQPGEKIAFNDVIYETSQETLVLLDSVFTDSIGDNHEHFLKFKELRERDTIVYYPDDIMLHAFVQDRNYQVLKEKKREIEWRIDFVFESKVLTEPKIKLLEDTLLADWYVQEYSEDSLSISYWVKDSALYNLDTISVLFDYEVTDTLDQFVMKQDTFDVRFKRKKKSDRQKRKEEKEKEKDVEEGAVVKVAPLKLEMSPKGSVPYFEDIVLTSPYPILSIRDTSIRLFEVVNDSTTKALKYKFIQDEQLARSYHIDYKWDDEKKYLLIIDSASIYDIYGHTNDSIGQKISITAEDQFSTIFLNLDSMKTNAVVQLLNASQEVIASQTVSVEQSEASFYYLKPNKYFVSLFYDTNGNGRWDPGNYDENIQAEERRFFPKEITAKAYYEMVEDWNVEALPLLEQKPKNLKEKKK